MAEPRKRFIAGATCPACGGLDVVQWWRDAGAEWMQCIRCDHLRQQPDATADEAALARPLQIQDPALFRR